MPADIFADHLEGHFRWTSTQVTEAACQNDHRDDVRSVFAWAIGTFTPSVVEPQPVSLDTNWTVQTFHDEITGDETRVTFVKNEGKGVVAVGCQVNTRKLNIYVEFGFGLLLLFQWYETTSGNLAMELRSGYS